MSFRLLAALLAASALLPSPAAAGGPGFEGLAAAAQRVDALEPFLAGYVGKCTDPYTRAECEQNLAARRRAVTGKTFAVRVADAAQLVRAELKGEGFLILLTPFVDGGGLALSHGVPARQDKAGNPLVNLIPIRGELAPGQLDMEFQSPFRVGAIELEIVFRPEKVWKLPRRGEPGQYEGVAARFLGVRVLDARTGQEIASRVL
jgi:hypothetical protein